MSETTDDATPEKQTNQLDPSGMGPAGLAAVGSVLLALYYYYVRGEEKRGQFIGLWPATILGLAAYLKLGGIERRLGDSE
ncbi:hypothetical protein GCM10008995_19170 [Halobellus salinus]|uniref:Uncharacterized protein n=1 Tax=Halobellus salinus TaxID=931585 RepID=A0A830EBE2_9EURY|nr:hypothetical protein [Halobellus salinus]GGJ09480.1 hypothetical protein GCM10008995_19170 [Halobellus salinus]SMP27491.1 hypothetical protein SAMN06265347_11291 [Halobellus salinus]